jgi:hypothetical protein
MATLKPICGKEEFAKRGDAIFDKDIRPRLKNEDDNDFVAIDIVTGAYEIDASETAASERLRIRLPKAQIWLRRVGSRFAHSFGGRRRPADQ